MSKNIRAITLTIVSESPVPLSYDQGYGNYTPLKKVQYKNKIHAKTSIATMTYDLRRILHQNFGWQLDDIVLDIKAKKIDKLNAHIRNIESKEENGLENDVFGYFIAQKGKGSLSKTSPLRIIPFTSLNSYKSGTQLITNRGFLEEGLGRKYYTSDNKEIERDDNFPTASQLAIEEVMGDYYVYTITLELDRIGVNEISEGKLVSFENREFIKKELREKAICDILDAICIYTRNIHHSTVVLKPLVVLGGAFEYVVPYFQGDIEYEENTNAINIDAAKTTIEGYGLENQYIIIAVDKRINLLNRDKIGEIIVQDNPIKAIKSIKDKVYVGEDNKWYVKN